MTRSIVAGNDRFKNSVCCMPAMFLLSSLLANGLYSSTATAQMLVSASCARSDLHQPWIVAVEYGESDKPVPCRVMYEKDGRISEVASARYEAGFCEAKQQAMIVNLSDQGFQCQSESSLTRGVADRTVAIDHFDGSAPGPGDRYAAMSDSFGSEREAHRFVGELKRLYPEVVAHVVLLGSGWKVSLGHAHDSALLNESISLLRDSVKERFDVVSITSEELSVLNFVADDWQRYAIASCYASGHTSTGSLSTCSGSAVGADEFLSCVGGGICRPESHDDVARIDDVDLTEVFGTDDPVARARALILEKMDGCASLAESDDGAFKACAVRAALPAEIHPLLECQAQKHEGIGFLKCAAGNELETRLALLERCTGSGAGDCLLKQIGNPALTAASSCTRLNNSREIASCAARNHLTFSDSQLLSCLDAAEASVQRARCLAQGHLESTKLNVLDCAAAHDDPWDAGACLARRTGKLSDQQLANLQCFESQDAGISEHLMGCLGGSYLSDEINTCIGRGVDSADCFDPTTLVTELAYSEVEEMLGIDSIEREITDAHQQIAEAEKKLVDFINMEVYSVIGEKFVEGQTKANEAIVRKTEEVAAQTQDTLAEKSEEMHDRLKKSIRRIGDWFKRE